MLNPLASMLLLATITGLSPWCVPCLSIRQNSTGEQLQRYHRVYPIQSSFDRDRYEPGRQVGSELTGTYGPTSWLYELFVDDALFPGVSYSKQGQNEFQKVVKEIDFPAAHDALKGKFVNNDGLTFREICSVVLMLEFRSFTSEGRPQDSQRSDSEANHWLELFDAQLKRSPVLGSSVEAFLVKFGRIEFDGDIHHRIETELSLLSQVPADFPSLKLALWRRLGDSYAEAEDRASASIYYTKITSAGEFSDWYAPKISAMQIKALASRNTSDHNIPGNFGRVW